MARENGDTAVLYAWQLEPGMAFGRRREIEAVEDHGDTVEVTYTTGRRETIARTVKCIVWKPRPDWQAIARQWREVALAMAGRHIDPDQRQYLLEPLEASWPG